MPNPDPRRNDATRLRQLLLEIYVSGSIRDDMPDREWDRIMSIVLNAGEGRRFADLGLPFPR